jgi:hypothetical protein
MAPNGWVTGRGLPPSPATPHPGSGACSAAVPVPAPPPGVPGLHEPGAIGTEAYQGTARVRRQTVAVPHPQKAECLRALCCVAPCFGLWWCATRGAPEERLISQLAVPSPYALGESRP